MLSKLTMKNECKKHNLVLFICTKTMNRERVAYFMPSQILDLDSLDTKRTIRKETSHLFQRVLLVLL
jgi:hypothetical protein